MATKKPAAASGTRKASGARKATAAASGVTAEKVLRASKSRNTTPAASGASPTKLLSASAAARSAGKRLRCNPEERKQSMDAAVLGLITKRGIAAITLTGVAEAAACSSGLVGRYYGGSAALKVAAVNMLAAAKGDSRELRRVFADGFDPKTKGLKLPKGFKVA